MYMYSISSTQQLDLDVCIAFSGHNITFIYVRWMDTKLITNVSLFPHREYVRSLLSN